MTQDEKDLVKSLIVKTKTQSSDVYWFLRNLIDNQELELSNQQRIRLGRLEKSEVSE